MTNIQVTIDDKTLRQIDRASKPLGLKRSEIVRQALRQWLQRQAIDQFEHRWIAALKNEPHDAQGAEDWLGAQAWSSK
jgi:metal-responsive CopG/Arc/MetJ family transcriptional regulator